MFSNEDEWSFDGFEAIEKCETGKTLEALRDIDRRLYEGATTHGVPNGVMDDDSGHASGPNRVDFGYAAHTESVGDRELNDWRGAFPYVMVRGINPSSSAGDGDLEADTVETALPIDTVGRGWSDSSSSGSASPVKHGLSLSVSGRRMVLNPAMSGTNATATALATANAVPFSAREESVNDDDDVYCVQGELSEYVALHRGNQATDDAGDGGQTDVISPTESMRAEITAILCDSVWHEVLETLRPLVRNVIAAAAKGEAEV